MKLYDTRRRQVTQLEPIVPGKIGMYTCGPTVYADAHIGNFRTYIFEDVLARTLSHFGYVLTRVMNITDVGHLVSDGDEGDDKLEVGARRDGTTAWEVAKKYEKRFLADLDSLQLQRPDKLVRATETIDRQIALIRDLEAAGRVYRLEDGIYFDAATFPAYAELARLDLAGLQAGARVEVVEGKRHPYDFALWKLSPPGSKRDMEWPSPWGVGFPGWHVECSAIALAELGDTLDIHCGGVDHIPIHHTNEIAQSESATGKRFANHWCHSEFLLMDGGKMSKSLGNLYTLSELYKRGIEPLAFKLFTYGAHYRSKQNFTWEALEAAQKSLQRLRELAQTPGQGTDLAEPLLKRFDEALSNDLNLPEAIAIVWELVRANLLVTEKVQALEVIENVLALNLFHQEEVIAPEAVVRLLKARETARADRQWGVADRLRAEIENAGFDVRDTPSGQMLDRR
jgi:cysteinyl-tRNA synthetase